MEGIQAAVPALMGTPKRGSERLCDVGQRFGRQRAYKQRLWDNSTRGEPATKTTQFDDPVIW